MGFWDFVAPDFPSFRSALLDVTPDYLVLGPVVLSQEELISLAWSNPFSGAGAAARLYYSSATYQVPRTQADGLWSETQRNLTPDRFGAGGGFGGRFDVFGGLNMATLIIPDAFRVSILGTSGGQPVTNVVGVVNASGTAEGAAEAVRDAWAASDGPLGYLPGFYTLTEVVAVDLSSANGAIASATGGQTGGGGVGAGLATNAACALVTWGGGTRSRSGRGRMYYGPLNEAMVNSDGRTIAPASLTEIQTRFDGFLADLSASGYPLAVLSPTLSIATVVQSAAVQAVIATQRRRIRD